MIGRKENLERALRRLTRDKVRASPRLTEEYRRRHRWDWVWRLGYLAFAPLLALTALTMLPFSFTFPMQLPLMLFLGNGDPNRQIIISAAYVLGGQSLFAGVIAAFLGIFQWTTFFALEDLHRATYFPVAESDRQRRNLGSWLCGFVYVGYVLGLVSINVALAARPNLLGLLALAIAVPLNAWNVMALAIVMASLFRPTERMRVAVMSCTLGMILATMGTALLAFAPRETQIWVGTLLMLFPCGWVNGAVFHLILEPTPWGLAFVPPLAGLWFYAIRWLWRGVSLREVFISPAWLMPVFERGLPNPREIDALYRPEPSKEAVEAVAPSSRAALEAAVARLLENSWTDGGWIERWSSRVFSARERTILEQVYRGRPRWTQSWVVGLYLTMGLVIASFLANWVARWSDAPINAEQAPFCLMTLLLIFPLLGLSESVALAVGASNKHQPGYHSLHPIYPIGWREYRRAVRKAVWWRLLLWTPILLLGLIPDIVFQPELVPKCLLGFVCFLFTCGVALETMGCILPAHGAVERTNLWEWSTLRIVPMIPLSFLSMLSFPMMVIAFTTTTWLVVPVWVLLFASGWAMQEYAGWCYFHTQLDFACRETMTVRARRRAW